MTTWRYRVVKHTDEENGFVWFDIREVYSGENELMLSAPGNRGVGVSWSADSKPPVGDTLEDLKADLQMMLKACDLPVLEERDGTLVEVK